MPCARRFAESHNTGTRQRTPLPSAWSSTLGKPEAHAIIHIYRVPVLGKQMALGKIWICRVPRSGHTAKPAHVLVMRDGRHIRLFCRVLPVWHSAKWDFVECLFQALGKVQFYPKKKNCGRRGNRARDLPHTKNPPLPSRRSLFSVQLGLRFLKLYI